MKTIVKTKGIFDATGGPMRKGAQMLIDGERIEQIGVDLPQDGAQTLDLSNCYVMPGLIDSHTHLSIVPGQGNQLAQLALPPGYNVLRSLPNIRAQLESGVTAMRIMGEEHAMDFDLRRAIEEGLIEGPRLMLSGTPIVATNGHGATVTLSDGETQVRRNIRRNFRRGADLVKLFVTGGMSSRRPPIDFCGYSRAEIAAAVDEAARMRTYVAAHAHGGPGVDACIEAGVHTIEHGALLTDVQMAAMKEKGMVVVITTSILYHPEGIEKTDFANRAIKAKVLANREVAADTYRRIIRSGLRYTAGSDSMHGLMHYEVANLVRFGAGNADALLAVTRQAAELLLMQDDIGTLERGKYADFIALGGNPLEDIAALEDVRLVYKGGKKVAGKGV